MTRLEGRSLEKRKGQTLAEFALTLPILLLLIFGIIEFGRIFQAWVTLQNAARAAARYATTGQYDEASYAMDLNYYPAIAAAGGNPAVPSGDVLSIVPCVGNDDISTTVYPLAGQRGTRNTSFMPNGAGTMQTFDIYTGGIESLYATWNGGENCDPSNPEHQARRKDMARLLSIMDEARRGAVGLGVGPSLVPVPVIGDTGANPELVPWYYVWYRPLPGTGTPPQNFRLRGSDTAGWFDVMVCSTRIKYIDTNEPQQTNPVARRFTSFPPDFGTDERAPVCILDEYPAPGSPAAAQGWTNNPDRAWLDAGGPGDTVNIVVTFNHPLITPLGIASFLPLQARRAAVNESFRAPRAVPISGALPDPDVSFTTNTPTVTPNPNTSTNTATFTPSATLTPSSTVSRTPTNTPTPPPVFSCDVLSLDSTVQFVDNQVRFTIRNSYFLAVTLHRVNFNWDTLSAYPDMGVGAMQLASGTIWNTISPDRSPATVIGAATSEAPFNSGASLNIAQASGVPSTTTLSVTIFNGPFPLFPTLGAYNFDGTVVSIIFNGTVCDLPFNATPPPNVTNPPPPTPICTPGLVRVSAVDFSSGNGVATFDITNSTNTPAIVVGFSINWVRYGSMELWRVRGGGTSLGASLPMWENAAAAGDTVPPTIGGSTPGIEEGTWLNNLTIAPFASSRIYVQFLGTGPQPLPVAVSGVTATNFNGTSFYFDVPGCVSVEVVVPVDTVPPPSLTASRTLTSTSTPTYTASNTATRTSSRTPTATLTASQTLTASRTPTATFTLTASLTPSRTNTPTPSNTPTPTFTRTNTPTRTNTATATATLTASRTPTASNTPTRTNTATASNTPTRTNTATATLTASRTATASNTPTRTNTATATNTATNTATRTPTNTASATLTASRTPTATATNTPTNTATRTNTPTASNTPTNTATQTRTNTPTATRTPTASSTPSATVTNTHTRTMTRTPTETPDLGVGCTDGICPP
ncbi:MAG: TadE/TadG family type IV pilus assembly protein [Chloroflexota bacterium]|nr:TadE/TadG family type IV pilus assembly protein [Chloroflexota bacterium]